MNIVKKFYAILAFVSLGAAAFLPAFFSSQAQSSPASLFIGPSSGTYVVGSTFIVSIFVNTNSQSINAIQADLKFPADKLQVVSPSAGKSFVGVWVAQPSYDNRLGSIKFQGAIPNPGINTSAGLISEVTFRVVSVGTALVRFEDSSRVLLNDGKGTDILGQTTGGVFNLALPPPAGPAVSSPTHPDQEKWYSNRNATLQWGSDSPVSGYSFVLSNQPIDVPDDISEGLKAIQSHKELNDDVHYFHIKALRAGSWGGVTHYSLKVDGTPPAHFKIEFNPRSRTAVKKPVINFATTDALSGVDHYELKIVSLAPSDGTSFENRTTQNFFIEANSPYIPELLLGDYDVFIRAYDRAGNYVEEVERLVIASALFNVIRGEGLHIRGNLIVPWIYIWILGIAIVALALLFFYRHFTRHRHIDERLASPIPEELRQKLEELRQLREKYKGLIVLLFGILAISPFFSPGVAAQGNSELPPPIVTQVARNITNREIFYIGGKSVVPNSQVIIYLQSLEDGGTSSHTAIADTSGDWFYTHPRLLSAGQYLLWVQGRVGEELSPPSAQISLTISAAALELGTSRLSYEAVYFMVSLLFIIFSAALLLLGIYHRLKAKQKHAKLLSDIRDVEESIRRGFAVLHRDIKTELALVRRAKEKGTFSDKEQKQEELILKDLEIVEGYIGKELWELEREA